MIYYVIDIDLEDGIATGNKTVAIFTIANNKPNYIKSLELKLEDNSEEKVKEWLIANKFPEKRGVQKL